MAMRSRIYESMTRVVVGDFVVRVWKSEPAPNIGPSEAVTNALQGLLPTYPYEIREALEIIPDIAAYEILDANGHGLVIYFDWP